VKNKLQLIQEEVARINQISGYDNSVGSTKTLGNDLSKIVIHHTKQLVESKSTLTESASDTKDADFNLNNIFATMDGNYLITDGQVVDLRTEEHKGHIFGNDFRLYLEIAESQRDTLYREGLYEAAFILNNSMLQISRRLMEHGNINLQEGDWSIGNLTDYLVPDFIATPDEVNKATAKVVKYAEKKVEEFSEWAGNAWDDVSKFVGDGVDWIKDTANKAWEWTKDSFLAILAKGFIWCAQALEAALFSVAGIVVDVVLGFTGVGAIAMAVLWGIVGVYRIYVWVKEGGWFNFLMVVCCLMGMLPAGATIAKVFKGGISVLKGTTSAAGAAAKLSKAFKPSQINWLAKVGIGIKTLIGYVFRGLNWLISKVPGMGGIASALKGAGAKVSKWLDKLLTKLGTPVTASSTTIAVVGGGVLGHEIYKAFSEGMNLKDIKEAELGLFKDYETDPEMSYIGVGEPFGKASSAKGDFETRVSEDSPKTVEWIAKAGSPLYKHVKNHPFFDGYKMMEVEPYGEAEPVFTLVGCSKKYGCPPGFEESYDGSVVQVEKEVEGFDGEFTQADIDGYEAAADAYVARKAREEEAGITSEQKLRLVKI
tara:strand:- start:1437 stop:3224 length:1788 start_codon:yes stop_codon:yes gene_type:complete